MLALVTRKRVVFVGCSVAVLGAAYWQYDNLDSLVSLFNERRNVIYPSSFTFLSILWAAALTIWGMLKSRATRYVERLHDNVVFRRFVMQMESRLVFGFAIIVASFAVYIADFMFAETFDRTALALLLWLWGYIATVVLIFDSLLTARVVLD